MQNIHNKKLHFIGIGGIGMSALAQVFAKDNIISGSDRNFDMGIDLSLLNQLENLGIKITKQDGSGVDESIDFAIYSSSIENQIPDLAAAKDLKLNLLHRSELLAILCNNNKGIAIGGTSGKTTSCGILSYVFYHCGNELRSINGGKIINLVDKGLIGNAYWGDSDTVIFEADESDGSIVRYQPSISVLNNIDLDHKPLDELYPLFQTFVGNTKDILIYNNDCPHIKKIEKDFKIKRSIRYGFDVSSDYRLEKYELSEKGSVFFVNGKKYEQSILGLHNILNSIPSIIIAEQYGFQYENVYEALKNFKGIKRRMEKVKSLGSIDIYDDYAHNPAKIEAAIQSLKSNGKNIIAIYQPHGFAPTRLMKDELINTFEKNLEKNDILLLPEIFYVGGTVEKSISSKEIIDELINRKVQFQAHYFEKRDLIRNFISNQDIENINSILIMGARDQTLSDFAFSIEI